MLVRDSFANVSGIPGEEHAAIQDASTNSVAAVLSASEEEREVLLATVHVRETLFPAFI